MRLAHEQTRLAALIRSVCAQSLARILNSCDAGVVAPLKRPKYAGTAVATKQRLTGPDQTWSARSVSASHHMSLVIETIMHARYAQRGMARFEAGSQAKTAPDDESSGAVIEALSLASGGRRRRFRGVLLIVQRPSEGA